MKELKVNSKIMSENNGVNVGKIKIVQNYEGISLDYTWSYVTNKVLIYFWKKVQQDMYRK